VKIGPEEVRKIAHLARLRLSEEEVGRFAGQLTAILEYVEKLNELDTQGIEPLANVVPAQTPFREDAVTSDFPPAQVTLNAPAAEQGMFRVPPVIDE